MVTLWRGARGLGLGIAGGADDAAGGGGVFVSHIAPGGAAHHDGRLRIGDKILAVRDEDVSFREFSYTFSRNNLDVVSSYYLSEIRNYICPK